MLHKTDWAYAAGILDGEGTVVIERSHDRKSRGHIRYRMHVTVVNTREDLVRWLQVMFGGFVYRHKWRNDKHADMWLWRKSGDEAAEFLKQAMPFLKLKRLQAETAIQFQQNVNPLRRIPLTEEELAVREAQRLTMNGLNRKGRN